MGASFSVTEIPISVTPEQRAATESLANFRNCDGARTAGATPIYLGEPDYCEAMDSSSDGIACEPYR
ncbi:excalibur calcium-binding domain-containing protein [Cypionkella sinensis]|uniref:excalibur calcium-binding domain-containing protein n=1 Tax=Cypionkella sinensis TaxID=1756043 RepID=UPI003628A8AB